VLDLLGVERPSIADAAAVVVDATDRQTAVFGAAPVTAVLEAPTHHVSKKRRRGRRMVAVVVAIAAAGALAFVGATIANADRVVDVPRVTGMTASQARIATAAAAHVDVAEAPLVVGGRPYSESVPDGRIVSQVPAAADSP